MTASIRKGVKSDLPDVLKLIKELAKFEKAPDEVENTIERMELEGFGSRPYFEFFVAEVDSNIVGLALYFFSYSTWKGKSLYLDDLIVQKEYRGEGIGTQLFNELLKVAKESNCGKVHWQVLDWNEPAIEYYKKIGSEFDEEWINCAIPNNKISKAIQLTQGQS